MPTKWNVQSSTSLGKQMSCEMYDEEDKPCKSITLDGIEKLETVTPTNYKLKFLAPATAWTSGIQLPSFV